jgi:hypothetical protein
MDKMSALLACASDATSRFWHWLCFYGAVALAWGVIAYAQPAETFANVRKLSTVAAQIDDLQRRLIKLSGVYRSIATEQYVATDSKGRTSLANAPNFTRQIQGACDNQPGSEESEVTRWCRRNWPAIRELMKELDAVFQKSSVLAAEKSELNLPSYHENVDELLHFGQTLSRLSAQLRSGAAGGTGDEALFVELYPPWKQVQDAGFAGSEVSELGKQVEAIQSSIPFITAMLRVQDMSGARSDILGRAGVQHDRAMAMVEIPGIGNPISMHYLVRLLPFIFFIAVFLAHINAERVVACSQLVLPRELLMRKPDMPRDMQTRANRELFDCLLPPVNRRLPQVNAVFALGCQFIVLLGAYYFRDAGPTSGDGLQPMITVQLILMTLSLLLFGWRLHKIRSHKDGGSGPARI